MSNGLSEERAYPADKHIHIVGLIQEFADCEDFIIIEGPDLGEEVFEELDASEEAEDPDNDDGHDDTDGTADEETEEPW